MDASSTPFLTGWFGQELKGARPRAGTYGRYPHDELSPLPFELTGDFGWLSRQAEHSSNIGHEKRKDNQSALPKLVNDGAAIGLTLPSALITFFQSSALQRRVRSCTDCFLDLSPAAAKSPVGDGFLVRFLADSQGCVFWYVFARPGETDHCVVASTDFYGTDAEPWNDRPPDPAGIIFCERSFEAFICRFWLENEIWFSQWKKTALSNEAQRYLAEYGRAK